MVRAVEPVLRFLWIADADGLDISELKHRLGWPRNHVVAALDELQEDGLVQAVADELFELTEEGQAACESLGLGQGGDRGVGFVPGDTEEPDVEEMVLEPFPTPNPWLQKLFLDPEFGHVPSRAIELLSEVSPDPEERLLAAVRTAHGRYSRGYVLLTTHAIRWVQTIPRRDDAYWSYDRLLEAEGSLLTGSLILAPDGRQFQIRPGKARAMARLSRLVQQSLIWDDNQQADQLAVVPDGGSGGLADELERLAELHQKGLLSEAEFAAAKKQLLA